ncbi:MAG: recombinase family protein [Anaerolineae bacterium]|nr:recombinase family protein [Anaerolineae bacterium]
MTTETQTSAAVRTIALGYIRPSHNLQGNESDSPEHQRAHIQAEADKHQYQVEWYEDVPEPGSGKGVNTRPGWECLEKRLADPDVAALIVFSIDKTHRKVSRFTELWEQLDRLGVKFIQAAPGRNIDFTAIGRGFAHKVQEIFDSYYAMDMLASNEANVDTEDESELS